MACGTPVIAFRRGSVPEVVKHGETGLIVETVEEMAAAIKTIDAIDRAACRRHVEEHFSIEKMAEGYERVFLQILEQKIEKRT
jgi:glycosyltransferase involved in cell wall biosynthesis